MLAPSLKQVFCAVRRQWVAATPEELVRQRLLLKLTQQLGYPSGHVAVEVSLQQMPHLREKPPLLRRADIICYAPTFHPLLLIECKAVPLNARVLRQAMGYNRYVQAHYVVVANEGEERIGRFDDATGEYQFTSGIPEYTKLKEFNAKTQSR